MKVRGSVSRQIVVDGEVDTFDIDTSSEDVSSDADSLVEFLEFLVAFDTGLCQYKTWKTGEW